MQSNQVRGATEALKPGTNSVDIWLIDLIAQTERVQQCRSMLSRDEAQRADQFYFERDRERFIVARAAMRQIVSHYAGLASQELRFSYGKNGKPELARGLEHCGIKFNLSHSSDLALLAIAHGLPLGVDIEWINPQFATDEIAKRFFSDIEVQNLQALPNTGRAEAFFSCWTRKEAYIKALGDGLSVPLDSFAVAFTPGMDAALLQVKADPAEVERWSMYNLDVGSDYKAALVAKGKDHHLQQREWNCALLK